MCRKRAGQNRDDVEAPGNAFISAMGREPGSGRVDDPALGAPCHRFQGGRQGLSCLDLDKAERVAAPGDDIDLAGGIAIIAFQDAVALQPQIPGGNALGPKAKPECGFTLLVPVLTHIDYPS